jgi:hypothetical protein
MDSFQVLASGIITAIISIVGSIVTFLFTTSRKIDEHKLHVAENYVKKEETVKLWEKHDGILEKVNRIEAHIATINANQSHQTVLLERLVERSGKGE